MCYACLAKYIRNLRIHIQDHCTLDHTSYEYLWLFFRGCVSLKDCYFVKASSILADQYMDQFAVCACWKEGDHPCDYTPFASQKAEKMVKQLLKRMLCTPLDKPKINEVMSEGLDLLHEEISMWYK